MMPIDLRKLILLFALLTALMTLGNSFYAAYAVQRQVLIDNSLEHGRAYSAKVASSINTFLQTAQQQLAYSARLLQGHLDDPALLASEVMRLQQQDSGFNSIVVVNASGRALASFPRSLAVDGQVLSSLGVSQALLAREPRVSDAYTSSADNLVVFISYPLVSPAGEYRGFVGGSIYLRERGALHTLISNHFYHDGTYAYVVDKHRRLLYHPEFDRVGSVVGANLAVDAVLAGQSGAMRLINSLEHDVLAGYAQIPSTGWGVVAQKSLRDTLAPLDGLMWQMLLGTIPVGVLGLIAIWWLALLITRPLRQLADNANTMDTGSSPDRIRAVRAWYFEADHIKRALLRGIGLMQEKLGRLNLQAQTDHLTGLLNRRAMEEALELMRASQQAFAIIALDIDHFKRVNDTFGHDAGDQVLAQVTALLRQCSRAGDLACRVGGEEFVLLLPGASIKAATEVGERFRQAVEHTPMPPAGTITVSLGIAAWPQSAAQIDQALKKADELMYQAKQRGRNRVVAAPQA